MLRYAKVAKKSGINFTFYGGFNSSKFLRKYCISVNKEPEKVVRSIPLQFCKAREKSAS